MTTPVRTAHGRDALARWQRIETLVQDWLEERERLLFLLCAVRGMHDAGNGAPVTARVRELCQVLMDYVSAGYFEIYRELALEARRFGRRHPDLVHGILRRLEDSTDEALAFNDDFDSPERIGALMAVLPQRINRLMAKLEDRFALEDQLITSIHLRDLPAQITLH